ncbi:efflux RND transporter periplasmic adaptor subunit [Arthrospiribacter ruber]|uniref:HlyD family efflux transporter periplasmic adaptor subunit n=1 Tax=Arthrospiribacter ruber TaxID=2487934 RepID=A0A951J2E7_9BACT|nr:efflux RND transporter periplasmic adaptor subunit [Arthrospiribacter ruber]MBW3470489.1 HlyD family efflux transporter periplasmic adaptor subunit [Arthrospiribacter ruber]
MRKRNIYIGITVFFLTILAYFLFRPDSANEGNEILAEVKSGKFKVEISTSGELQALNSVQVLGPTEARRFRVGNFTIEEMVDEGTVVKKGDVVAVLDRTELFGRLEDKRLDLEQTLALFEQTQLDTSLVLRQERDNILNLQYDVEERELVLEQSQYEPPAIIKQNENSVERAKRDLQQAKDRYRIKLMQERARMVEVSAKLKDVQTEVNQIEEVLEKFTVTAPQNGMVIYVWGRGGKIKEGSQVSSWNPVVATLPDLTHMQSITYINEVDIRKVEAGQRVELGLDAFPEKKLTGKVTKVANVGQQRPNSDAKVFEVTIVVNESDPLLRPAMTTSNTIVAEEIEEATFIPLEALYTENDSINYVHLKSGKKQEVKLGLSNSNYVIVESGLQVGQQVYLSTPNWSENVAVNLLDELNGKRNPELQDISADAENLTQIETEY